MTSVYATGFNAHNQIVPGNDARAKDVRVLTKITQAEHEARVVFAGWSSTVSTLSTPQTACKA